MGGIDAKEVNLPPHYYIVNTDHPRLRKMKNDKKERMPLSGAPDAPSGSFPVGGISIDVAKLDACKPQLDALPILPTRNLVLFPGVHMTLGLGRETSVHLAQYAEQHTTPIGIVCQMDPDIDVPTADDLFRYGVVADVLKVIEFPDGSKTALLRARGKFRINQITDSPLMKGVLQADVTPVREPAPRKNDFEFDVTVNNIRQAATAIFKKRFDGQSPFETIDDDPVGTVNAIATNMPFDTGAKFEMLATSRLRDRAMMLLVALEKENERLDVSRDIMERAHSQMESNQRNAFLQMQMDTIREELYGNEADDAERLQARLDELDLDPDSDAHIALVRELGKLRRLNPSSPDYMIQYSYIDNVLQLPWKAESERNTDFDAAAGELESGHYGLEKVKDRIIEQLAMIMDNPDGHAPILCLVGPPGVGKTSLGKSVAAALGLRYQRVALGGLHDEAEIRGHRRTYLGAMPGRIMDAVRRAGTRNPVLMLDEIDKIGADFKGDPAAALLEVLDPEQNVRFHDNYIDLDFDLGKVLFIATANTLDTVSRPLLDRMEVIEIPGYLAEEKVEIAKRHLLPEILRKQGWKPASFKVSDEAIADIIDRYTAESGVRQLQKRLEALFRKAVVAKQRRRKFPKPVKAGHLNDLLGAPRIRPERCPTVALPGVVTGMAWTAVGGTILLVEASLTPATGKTGGHLTLTGNLGDVMKESAGITLQWVMANAVRLGINPRIFADHNIHVHFPEGAVPKDGPSAGVTITTAIVSALTGRLPKLNVAMTGEATLRGVVLPVGGIRDKILAARRAGVTDVILCEDNRVDVEEIPARYIDGLNIHYVRTLDEVLQLALQ